MNPFRLTCLSLLLSAALPALATVTVSFPSQMYTDIGPPGRESDDVKNELARHLQSLDAKYLASGDNLWIEVIDVDLAGNRTMGRYDIRVSRGKSDFPTVVVRYKLERGGKTTSGEDTLTDSSYQQSMTMQGSSSALYHEKRLLEGWFKERFARR